MAIRLRRLARSLSNGAIIAFAPAAQSRAKLTATYCGLELQHLFLARRGPGETRLLDSRMKFRDLGAFLLIFEEIFIRRVYEVGDLGSNPTIVDCGANIGMATLYFRWRYPGARILAFEPDPRVFGVLETNVADNGWDDVEIRNEAVGAGDGLVDFFVSAGRPAQLTMTTAPAAGRGQREQVRCVPLSAHLPDHVDLLKLDIEGSEREVLRELDTSRALERVEHIAMEYHHHLDPHDDHLSETLELLERNGFGYSLSTVGWPGDVSAQTRLGALQENVMVYAYRQPSLPERGRAGAKA